jgi:hypothetical protein
MDKKTFKKLKTFSKGGRVKLKQGDVITTAANEDANINQNDLDLDEAVDVGIKEQEDMNKKDLVSMAAAATITATGVNADINKAVENNILPKQKPVELLETNSALIKGKKISNLIETKLNERGIKNSKNIANGLTGNIYAENSKFITNQEEIGDINTLKDKQRGYGLFQFTDYKNSNGELIGHKTEYNKYLNNNNKADNAESQIDYVLDNIFKKNSGFDVGAGNKKELKLVFSEGDSSDIAKIFMKLWERPADESSLSKRIKFAKELFKANNTVDN